MKKNVYVVPTTDVTKVNMESLLSAESITGSTDGVTGGDIGNAYDNGFGNDDNWSLPQTTSLWD